MAATTIKLSSSLSASVQDSGISSTATIRNLTPYDAGAAAGSGGSSIQATNVDHSSTKKAWKAALAGSGLLEKSRSIGQGVGGTFVTVVKSASRRIKGDHSNSSNKDDSESTFDNERARIRISPNSPFHSSTRKVVERKLFELGTGRREDRRLQREFALATFADDDDPTCSSSSYYSHMLSFPVIESKQPDELTCESERALVGPGISKASTRSNSAPIQRYDNVRFDGGPDDYSDNYDSVSHLSVKLKETAKIQESITSHIDSRRTNYTKNSSERKMRRRDSTGRTVATTTRQPPKTFSQGSIDIHEYDASKLQSLRNATALDRINSKRSFAESSMAFIKDQDILDSSPQSQMNYKLNNTTNQSNTSNSGENQNRNSASSTSRIDGSFSDSTVITKVGGNSKKERMGSRGTLHPKSKTSNTSEGNRNSPVPASRRRQLLHTETKMNDTSIRTNMSTIMYDNHNNSNGNLSYNSVVSMKSNSTHYNSDAETTANRKKKHRNETRSHHSRSSSVPTATKGRHLYDNGKSSDATVNRSKQHKSGKKRNSSPTKAHKPLVSEKEDVEVYDYGKMDSSCQPRLEKATYTRRMSAKSSSPRHLYDNITNDKTSTLSLEQSSGMISWEEFDVASRVAEEQLLKDYQEDTTETDTTNVMETSISNDNFTKISPLGGIVSHGLSTLFDAKRRLGLIASRKKHDTENNNASTTDLEKKKEAKNVTDSDLPDQSILRRKLTKKISQEGVNIVDKKGINIDEATKHETESNDSVTNTSEPDSTDIVKNDQLQSVTDTPDRSTLHREALDERQKKKTSHDGNKKTVENKQKFHNNDSDNVPHHDSTPKISNIDHKSRKEKTKKSGDGKKSSSRRVTKKSTPNDSIVHDEAHRKSSTRAGTTTVVDHKKHKETQNEKNPDSSSSRDDSQGSNGVFEVSETSLVVNNSSSFCGKDDDDGNINQQRNTSNSTTSDSHHPNTNKTLPISSNSNRSKKGSRSDRTSSRNKRRHYEDSNKNKSEQNSSTKYINDHQQGQIRDEGRNQRQEPIVATHSHQSSKDVIQEPSSLSCGQLQDVAQLKDDDELNLVNDDEIHLVNDDESDDLCLPDYDPLEHGGPCNTLDKNSSSDSSPILTTKLGWTFLSPDETDFPLDSNNEQNTLKYKEKNGSSSGQLHQPKLVESLSTSEKTKTTRRNHHHNHHDETIKQDSKESSLTLALQKVSMKSAPMTKTGSKSVASAIRRRTSRRFSDSASSHSIAASASTSFNSLSSRYSGGRTRNALRRHSFHPSSCEETFYSNDSTTSPIGCAILESPGSSNSPDHSIQQSKLRNDNDQNPSTTSRPIKLKQSTNDNIDITGESKILKTKKRHQDKIQNNRIVDDTSPLVRNSNIRQVSNNIDNKNKHKHHTLKRIVTTPSHQELIETFKNSFMNESFSQSIQW